MLQVGMETNPVSLEAVWQYILEASIITTLIIKANNLLFLYLHCLEKSLTQRRDSIKNY